MIGAGKPYEAKPWFWSDQYDVKLQITGLNTGYERIITRSSEGAAASFWYYKGNILLGVDAINDARTYMIGKRLIGIGISPQLSLVSDVSVDLKSLLPAIKEVTRAKS